MGNRKYIEKIIFIALLVALSVVLGIIDSFLSSFIATPGVRIGLANIIILTGLYYLDFKESLLLVILKSIISGFLLGNFMTFLIGFSGTMFSFIGMYILLRFGKNKVSLVGVSLSGSILHNIGQIVMLIKFYSWTISFALFWLIPLGFGAGIFVGYMVALLNNYLDKGQVFKTITNKQKDNLNILALIEEEDS